MTMRLFFRDLDPENEKHPVDGLVEARVGARRKLRKLAELSDAIVRGLGLESKLWFEYEQIKSVLCSAREEAYFDVGVEHGLAAAHANELAEPRRRVRNLAQHLLREALASGLPREDAAAAAVLASWSLLDRVHIARQRS
ncbi:MAG: hypothetical protein H5U40_12855 [Polyangiaceae bacterium]|nr:hypothetical protein [Polyangiaceae bacterium]